MKKYLTQFLVMTAFLLGGGLLLYGETADASVLYRAYNPNTGEHLYTQNKNEIPFVVKNGWRDEGTAWQAPDKGTAVYRLFNPNNGGDHFYTLNTNERDQLQKVGWRYEGVSWYSGGSIPVYRLYNPNAKSGTHHYTLNTNERDQLRHAGWRYEGVAFQAAGIGQTPSNPGVAPRKVDVNVTGVGGAEQSRPGSYRFLYSNKGFDQASLGTATIEFAADVALSGSASDYENQFVIAGNGSGSGQIGVALHYQAGSDGNFAQGRINTTTINFPANAGTTGQQYYSVNTNAPRISNGQSVRLQVKYFASGYMQTFVNGTLVGQYKTTLVPGGNAYILHNTVTNASARIRNLKVYREGKDVTTKGKPSFSSTSYDLTNRTVDGAY